PLELAALHTEQISVVEVVLAPRTELAGRTLASINFRDRYGLNVLGIWRGGAAPRRTHLTDVVLQGGDAMLLQGPMARIANLRTDRNFVVVTAEVGLRFRSSRAPVAVVILLGFVGVVLAGVLPVAIGALAGAAAMVATGCVTMHEARASVDWRAILLVAAMLAMAEAMRTTGAAALIANGMVAGIGGGGPWPVLAGIVLLSCLFAHAMSNHVTAVLMAPIAIDAAVHAGADPRMFAMGVALGATMPFMSPYAHPANLLVMGPGNYLFGDYVRAGLPLVAVTLAASLVMLYFVYGR
ncbi:MAG: anion permease, partial [Actinobacteria bacterium]|nr:anion permease [Actinomycetota bacterium]